MIDLKPNKNILVGLLSSYLIFMACLAISPFDRTTWFVENATVWIVVSSIAYLYFNKIRFSTFSYLSISIFIFLHTIGGHYTFANVPFDYVTELFGFTRNHFDRIAHFSVGFFAYPIFEWVISSSKYPIKRFLLLTYPVLCIVFVAVMYEWIEWIYAAKNAGPLGAAYLGSQGDIWDAQKDMLADTLGASLAAVVFYLRNKQLFTIIK